jgi:hypothetical protein
MKVLAAALLIFFAGLCRAEIVVPPGFELQKLDTTQGRIAKPKGWFYSHAADKFSLRWTIAREDPNAGPYQTGFRIQFVPDATKAAKVPPERFVENFIAQKLQSADVKRQCPAVKVGQFLRRCLETVEGPHRILYSLFWSQELDAIVVTIFGAPVAEWEKARHIADRMNEFELLGADFWKK